MQRGLPIATALIMMIGMCACSASAGAAEATTTISLHAAPDADIERRLTSMFAQIDGLQDVRVRVRDGVVHLSGTADNVALEHRATSLARRVEDVVDVSSDVRSHAPDRWLAATWRALRRVTRSVADILPQLTAAVLVFVPFLLLSLLVGRWRHPLRVFGVRQLTGGLARFVLRGALIIAGVLLGLDVLGVTGTVGAVVGTIGVLGLAAGVVFKDWVANYFPAMMLGVHPPFEAGDLVQVGDHEGRVVRITPRATVLMTLDGAELRIPNSALFERTLVNYSRHRERRLRFVVPLALHADLQVAQEVGRHALLQLHGVKPEPPPFMRVRTLARDFVEVEFFAWVDQESINFRTVESRARRAVLESLASAGIRFPADTRIVHLERAPALDEENQHAQDLDDAFVAQQLERAQLDVASPRSARADSSRRP